MQHNFNAVTLPGDRDSPLDAVGFAQLLVEVPSAFRRPGLLRTKLILLILLSEPVETFFKLRANAPLVIIFVVHAKFSQFVGQYTLLLIPKTWTPEAVHIAIALVIDYYFSTLSRLFAFLFQSQFVAEVLEEAGPLLGLFRLFLVEIIALTCR